MTARHLAVRVLRALAACSVLVIALGIATANPASARTTRTVVYKFAPWETNGTLDPAVTISARRTGHCWTGSIAVDNLRVWRCVSGNAIYDPCFAPADEAHATEVVCDPLPWSGATLLRLTAALPLKNADRYPAHGPSERVWAFELSNGARCFDATGAAQVIKGVVLMYLCTSAGSTAFRDGSAGSLLTSRQPWVVEYVPSIKFSGMTAEGKLQSTAIAVAWSG
jgi:hypothetical protein